MRLRNYSPRSILTYSSLLAKAEDDLQISLEAISIQQFKDNLHHRIIQEFMGHVSIKTTSVYLHLANTQPRSITSPLDSMDI